MKLIISWRTSLAKAMSSGAVAAVAQQAPSSPPAGAAAADDAGATQELLVEDIAGIGEDKLTGKARAKEAGSESPEGSVEDARVLLRRAAGKGVNPGSFLGLMLGTRDSSTGKAFADEVVSGGAGPRISGMLGWLLMVACEMLQVVA
jgi:hypothetical protein